ncbi:ribosomal RNA small subunit methyltransferase [Emiliania huxleyi CCMP1516]|uniref:SAM-dependent MTase RsmB/NOP-type domain-containing protein n=2 Tax=Emiliania huxleyi TaxID=2903 RepID=A0A0D3HXS4_EMIH1|nr:ribosomal RNA small subunit methyltransferase [Emiliania huxleyi CCMP1516]EOD03809.1 ribosomal RNA small subunit methyltransferase [Emiliania huxleyi CCMP1516]|eukprot:XP_005756238.1 ribosomal RNA small subunit methyltransferase [Emiliania huxleyi CCMP1516]
MSRAARRAESLIRSVRALEHIIERKRGLEDALPRASAGLEARAGGVIHDTVAGTLRHLHQYERRLDAAAAAAAGDRAWRAVEDMPLRLLMASALFQCEHTPASAAHVVRSATEGCAQLGRAWAQAPIESVVRNAAAGRGFFSRAGAAERLSLPAWLHEDLVSNLGARRLDAFGPLLLQRPSRLHLAVASSAGSPSEYAARLSEGSGPAARLVAVERSRRKAAALRESLAGEGRAAVVCGDATRPEEWAAACGEGGASAVVLDAPCSASGILRTRPEAKVHQSRESVEALCETQQRLLRAAWSRLAPGGELLYTTCSLLRAENEEAVQRFAAEAPGATLAPLRPPRGALSRAQPQGVTFLPSEEHQGGFVALLRKGERGQGRGGRGGGDSSRRRDVFV